MEEIVLLPRDTYMVSKLTQPKYIDYDVLTLLYQPLLEAEAYSLLMFFWCEDEHVPRQHSLLLSTFNFNIRNFLACRIKLEGLGLLKTFENRQETYHSFLYQLQKPVSAATFFQDDVLSALLLERVGEARYKELLYKFKLGDEVPNLYQEITKDFQAAYQLSDMSLRQNQYLQKENGEVVKQPTKVTPKLRQQSNINFEVLVNALNTRVVDPNSVRMLQETIMTLQKLYNLAFDDLVQFITQAADAQTGRVTRDNLTKQITQASANATPEKQVIEENQQKWQAAGIDQQTIEVFNVALQAAPIDFLTSIKEQLGGQQTSAEFYTVRNAMQKSSLPVAVINIVIYILLVQNNYPELPQKVFDRILDQLGQRNIIEMADVWQQVPKILETSNTYSKRRQYTKTKPTKQLAKADMKQVSQKATKAPVNKQKLDQLRQELNEI